MRTFLVELLEERVELRLHRAYCEWELSHGAPCNRETFETLLREAGFLIVDTMVSGLILRGDFDGVRVYPEVNPVLR